MTTAERGMSLIESMLAVSLMFTLTGLTVPTFVSALDASRSMAAARYVAAQAGLARMQAATLATRVALRFEVDGGSYRYQLYMDGNGDGVRATDIATGIDLPLGPPERLEDRFTGMSFAIGASVAPVGTDAPAGPDADAVRLGASDLLSFSPFGTATSGTIYLRSRQGRQYAVRILGATGRVRVLEYSHETGEWLNR